MKCQIELHFLHFTVMILPPFCTHKNFQVRPVSRCIEPRRHLTAGLDMHNAGLGELRLSPVYESSAVGFAGDPFWNMVAGMQSNIELGRLIKTLKFIEDANGRDRSGPKFGPRTLDIDILIYDDLVGEQQGVWLPRDEITE